MNIVDLAALRLLVLHDNSHRHGLGLGVRLQTPDLRSLSFGMRDHEDARETFNPLKRQGPLVLQFLPASFPSCQEFGVPRLGLRQAPFSPLDSLFDFPGCLADLFILLLEKLGQ
jgi:hypothetical protein